MMASLPSLLEQIDQLQVENQSVQDKVDDEIKRERAKDQSRIAWIIIWAFVVAVGCVVLLVIGGFVAMATGSQLVSSWEKSAEFLVKVISSFLLPIVTLVLGYYFGKEKTE